MNPSTINEGTANQQFKETDPYLDKQDTQLKRSAQLFPGLLLDQSEIRRPSNAGVGSAEVNPSSKLVSGSTELLPRIRSGGWKRGGRHCPIHLPCIWVGPRNMAIIPSGFRLKGEKGCCNHGLNRGRGGTLLQLELASSILMLGER